MKYFFCNLHPFSLKSPAWRDARVVEEARLESVYTPKVYRGFESRSLRTLVKECVKEKKVAINCLQYKIQKIKLLINQTIKDH